MQSSKAKILLVEDDASLGFLIRDNLEDKGYEVIYSPDGETGWAQVMRHNIDISPLDVMLPKKDGMTLAGQIRKKNEKTPILFLTAKSLGADWSPGLEAGGDDYSIEPSNMAESLLRIEVFLKRSRSDENTGQQQFQLGRLHFDYGNLLLTDDTHTQQLTQKEAALLRYLALNVNTVVKRED